MSVLSENFRQVDARVEIYADSTLVETYSNKDYLKSFSISYSGDSSKMWGYGICQKLDLKLVGQQNMFSWITYGHSFVIYISVNGSAFKRIAPTFYLDNRSRNTDDFEISLTAYDKLYVFNDYTLNNVPVEAPNTIRQYVNGVSNYMGMGDCIAVQAEFGLTNPGGAKFEGREPLRKVMDEAAEVTGTIYYISNDDVVTFKRLDTASVEYDITRNDYFSLDSGDMRVLTSIIYTKGDGDELGVHLEEAGSKMYIEKNAFWEERPDSEILGYLQGLQNIFGRFQIHQFSTNTVGMPNITIGDRLKIATRTGDYLYSYLLNSTISYDGAFRQSMQWESGGDARYTASTLGEQITTALNKAVSAESQISGVVDEMGEVSTTVGVVETEVYNHTKSITDLQVNNNDINKSIQSMNQSNQDMADTLNADMAELNNKVNNSVSAEQMQNYVDAQLSEGTNKVVTHTGYIFDDTGLTINKTNSELTTTITEDGMQVKKNNQTVLVANNAGVDAQNLHATTYLIIGLNSRFEDFNSNRTGCFYIGS